MSIYRCITKELTKIMNIEIDIDKNKSDIFSLKNIKNPDNIIIRTIPKFISTAPFELKILNITPITT